MTVPEYQSVLKFWFEDHSSEDWFGGKAEFDAELEQAFGEAFPRIAAGEAWLWRKSPEGRLAEILALDQFSRQLYRGSSQAFATDAMALTLTQELVARGEDQDLPKERRHFAYMPYMHSESLAVQKAGREIFASLENEGLLDYMDKHIALIERFGRFPMRNVALGRISTPEEEAYIAERDGKMF